MSRNLILFIALSVVCLAGWVWLRQTLWPPTPAPGQAKTGIALSKLPPPQRDAVTLAHLAGQQAAGADVWSVALTVERTRPFLPRPIDLRGLVARNPELAHPVALAAAAAGNVPPLLAAIAYAAPKADAPKVAPAPKEVTIGGEGFNIEAVLTTRGAGVSRLTLTHFKAADWLGQPTRRDLELIPSDPFNPSYVLYHYADLSARNPVLGLGEQLWTFDGTAPVKDGVEARFSTTVPGLDHVKITKVYTLEKNTYHLGLTLELHDERTAGAAVPFRYQLVGAHGLPIEGEWYTSVFRNAVVGMADERNALWRTLVDSHSISVQQGAERVPAADRQGMLLQYAGVINQYFAALIVVSDEQADPEAGGVNAKDILAWARPTNETEQARGRISLIKGDGDRLGFKGKDAAGLDVEGLFTLLPHAKKHLKDLELKENDEAVITYYVTPEQKQVVTWLQKGKTIRPQFDDITVRVHSEVVELKPGARVAHKFLLYHGPVKTRLLGQVGGEAAIPGELVDRYTDTLHLKTLTDYPSAGIGWIANKIFLTDLIILCTKAMHALLHWLTYVIPNYGLAIILLTVIVRGAMHPISRRQAYFSIKMQELAPEMKRIQERYKNDPQAKTQAVMELYRRHNVHPLGSCLPLVLQMPIFLGLYFALQESIQFRLAPFLWMDNLAAPDMLIWWTQSIPFISDPDSLGSVFYLGPYLNLLPVVAVVLMVIQQQLMTPPPTDEQQAAQQKMMKYMSIFIGVLFYKMPAGLCVYFIASSLWGLAERQLLPKKKTLVAPAEGPASSTASPAQNRQRPPRPKAGPAGRRQQPAEPAADGPWQKIKGWWADILRAAEKK